LHLSLSKGFKKVLKNGRPTNLRKSEGEVK
jgi:hypothetical protein